MPSLKVPLKAVVVLSTPAVKVAEVPPLLVTVPLPANEPTLLENPLRSSDGVDREGRVCTEPRGGTGLQRSSAHGCRSGVGIVPA